MTPSITAENKYAFKCPTTGREDLYIRCATRRHMHWRGQTIEADCATCMRAGKCAALAMLGEEWKTGKALFFNKEPGVHRLPARIIEKIERVQVMRSHGSGTGIDTAVLESLVRGDFDGVVGTRNVPNASLAELGEAPIKLKRDTSPFAGLADKVDGDMASQLNKAIAA